MLLHRIVPRRDMIRCALCADAPCTMACGRMDCARMLRRIWFDNEQGAVNALPADISCASCSAPCESACIFPGEVPVRSLLMRLSAEKDVGEAAPADLSLLRSEMCGIPLENPFLLSSSVVASTYEMCARAFDMGWAGAAFKTVSMMDIHEASPRFSAINGEAGAIIGFKNIEQLSDHSLIENAEMFRKLKANYPNKLLLASIMGRDDAEWTEIARVVTEAGADALELNFSCPNMTEDGTGSDVGQIPELVERFTRAARQGSALPILAKLTPNVASMTPAAEAALRGGADGLSAINTIKSIINVSPHTYASAPAVRGFSAVGGYSGSAVKPIALNFVAELARLTRGKDVHISGMGGIETWHDALEFMLLGAGSVQITTAVMQYGYRIIDDLREGLALYMEEKGFSRVGDLVGLGFDAVKETEDIERSSVVYPHFLRNSCVGCGRCALSCSDGGHSAIRFDAETRKPTLDPKKCVGCHLCVLVCPAGAIAPGKKRV